MHLFKSRNPIWLILDVVITYWLWKAGIHIAFAFFLFDSIIQLIYTFFPEFNDGLDKSKKYRIFYAVFYIVMLISIFLHLTSRGII